MIPKLSALAATSYSAGACAANVDGAEVSVSAFGTFGLVHSSEGQADFTSSITKPTGASYSHGWSSDVDSIIGAQVTANFTPKLSAVVRVISEQNADNTYKPQVEWANVKFQGTDDLSVRIGRTVMPYLLFSDARNVAYATPWVRLPSAIYSLSPLTRSDGLDVSYRLHVGEWTNTLQGLVGKQDIAISPPPLPSERGILPSSRGPANGAP